MVKGDKNQVAVIGGGPAGIMSAITASESGAKVILLEKNNQLSKKLLLTGGGRCNITNAEFNLRNLVSNYRSGEFLFHAFSVFGPERAIKFFDSIGVKTKTEKNNRVFPVSESAEQVRDALNEQLAKNGVEIVFGAEVKKIVLKKSTATKTKKLPKIEKLVLADKSEIKADKFILATGGRAYQITGSDGSGYAMAESLGHKIAEQFPSISPIKIKDWIAELQGLSLKNIKLSMLSAEGKKQFSELGDIVFTHFGISGPAALNLSRNMSEGEQKISIDLLPDLNFDQLEKKINSDFNGNPRKDLKNYLAQFMPQRMAGIFTEGFQLNGSMKVNNLNRVERADLAKYLKNIELVATGVLGFELAMATRGGVALNEIDHKTMKSKLVDNLYFAGEIIDIDGKTGGFNLQSCWSTGYLAGKNAI